MNYFRDIKFYKVLVLILIVLNLLTLGFIWHIHHSDPFIRDYKPNMEEYQEQVMKRNEQYLGEHLNLDSAQIKQFKALRQQHFELSSEIMQEIGLAKKELMKLAFDSSDVNKAQKDSLIGIIGEKQMEFERVNFDHFESAKAICRSDQLNELEKTFKLMFGRVLRDPECTARNEHGKMHRMNKDRHDKKDNQHMFRKGHE